MTPGGPPSVLPGNDDEPELFLPRPGQLQLTEEEEAGTKKQRT